MLVTLSLVQINKARREVKWTNHVQTKINIMKALQTSVIHLIPGSTCHWILNRVRYFFKNIFWSKHFPGTTDRRSGIHGSFLWNLFWKFHKFPRRIFPVSVRTPGTLFKKSNFTGMFFLEIYKIFRTAILRNYTFFCLSS